MTALRRATGLALAASLIALAVGLRHHLIWGAGHRLVGVELHVWLGIGEGLGLALFTVVAAAAWQRALRCAEQVTLPMLLRAGALVAIVAALVPPTWSSDVFDYIARGRVEAHFGRNPYLVPPAAIGGNDPVLALAEWPAFVMPYGPISALVQAACAGLAGGVPWLGVYLFKLLCAAAHVLTGWLLARAAPPANTRTVAALWLFHPWILLECCGSAHNEALVTLALAFMLERLARDRWTMATFAFGLAVLTKHGCAPLGPVLLALAVRRRRLGAFIAGVGACALLTALCAWRYFLQPGALDFLSEQAGNRGTSAQHFLSLLLGPASQQPLLLLGYAGTLGAVGIAAARTRTLESFATHGVRLLVLFIALAMPLFSPWYHLWWAPLACVLPLTHPANRSLRALAWLGPLSYAVYAVTRELDLPHQAWAWATACLLPALIIWRGRARDAVEPTALP